MTNNIRAAAVLIAAATAASAMGRRPPQKSDAKAAPAGESMTIQEWKGQMGGPAVRGHQIVYDEPSWKGAWRELGKDAPPLDFAKFAAVVVYVGERPTGGFTAVFEEPQPQGDDLLVRYRIPKPTGFTTQAFTQPWKVRAVPRPKGRVIVEYLSQ
jgi:hypothetical protein